MPHYILTYHDSGKKPESPEKGAEDRKKWTAWLEGLGEAVIDPGTPLGKFKLVSAGRVSDESGLVPLIGFSILKADNMEEALEMAKQCPYQEMGPIGVAEIMKM